MSMRHTALMLLLALPLAAGSLTGTVKVARARDHRDAVVYLDRIPGKQFPPPDAPVVLDQVNLLFLPHVLPVLVGTTVAFPNNDTVRHNVFSPSPAKRFNLGTYAQKVTQNVVFDKPGVVALLCNVHAEMSAYVIVTETPYFAVTKASGEYQIPNVPAGSYVLKAWHESGKPKEQKIEVTEGTPAHADFDLR
jgi:plastocyanin